MLICLKIDFFSFFNCKFYISLKILISFIIKRFVRFLSTFHNPNTEKYGTYYSIVLVVIIGTVLVQNLGLIHMSPIEGGAVFIEGFVSLVMLARHSKTKECFPHYISKLKFMSKLSITNS